MNNSKKILKGIAIGTSLAMGSMIPINGTKNEDPYFNREYDENILNYESDAFLRFNEFLSNVDMSDYDINFVDLYRNGSIVIDEISYNIDDLFIEIGQENNIKRILLISCNNSEYDILTKTVKSNFVRESINLLKKTQVFYQLYEENKENFQNNCLSIEDKNKLIQLIYSFDGELHDKTPEMAYKSEKTKKY